MLTGAYFTNIKLYIILTLIYIGMKTISIQNNWRNENLA